MAQVEVPAAPPMGRVANVELMHTGTWDLSTGTATFTVEDLAAAVAALDCPAVRRPILKLGHTPDPAPGQPAVGFVANMATAEQGRVLVGDYVGMPGWLVDEDENGDSVLTSAYPDRSVEGAWGFQCQLGHHHPFVITAVALLGEERPAIGTIQSLQDLADLYGVAAAADDSAGEPVTITIHSTQGGVMPNPRLTQIAASVTTEDVRRAYYASPYGDGWSVWIEEIQVDPVLQLIVMDDEKAMRSRVPVTIGDGDGADAVTFGDPIPVVVRYDDAPVAAAAPAPVGRSIRFASRAESRPTPTTAQRMAEVAAAAVKAKTSPVIAGAGTTTEGAGMDPAKLREGLGLAPDASDEEVNAAMQAALGTTASAPPEGAATGTPAAEPQAVAAHAPRAAGTMVIDASAWDEQQKRINRLEAEATKRAREERDQVIAAAVSDGKFAPARKEHWVRLWDADPEGTRQVIAGLTKNVIPVAALGFADDGDLGIDDEFAHLYPPVPSSNRKGA